MTVATTEATSAKGKYYPVLDLVRFIAAMLIVFIHVFPEGSNASSVGFDTSVPMLLTESFVYALLRGGVPLFFLISAFLLFRRIEADKEHKWKHVGAFCLRLLFLYLFWYVVALPLTVRDIVGFVSANDTYGLVRYIVITLWKGAPRGFWFLVALALGILISAKTEGKKSLIALLVVSGILYAYGCLNSAYFGLFKLSDDPFSRGFYLVGDYLELAFCPLEGLFFVALGKVFALHGPFKIKGNTPLIVLAFLLMVGELFLTLYLRIHAYADAFFTLPLFVFLLLNRLLPIETKSASFALTAKRLKKVGSFSYLFHVQFFVYMHWILDASGYNPFRENIYLLFLPYLACVLLCFLLQPLFERLSWHRYLGFLKYSY